MPFWASWKKEWQREPPSLLKYVWKTIVLAFGLAVATTAYNLYDIQTSYRGTAAYRSENDAILMEGLWDSIFYAGGWNILMLILHINYWSIRDAN